MLHYLVSPAESHEVSHPHCKQAQESQFLTHGHRAGKWKSLHANPELCGSQVQQLTHRLSEVGWGVGGVLRLSCDRHTSSCFSQDVSVG